MQGWVRELLVEQPNNDNFQTTDVGPPCPKCGKPMSMTIRKLPDKHGYEQRTVTCAECGYGETSVAKID